MLHRQNHPFELLGRTLRDLCANAVAAPLPPDMLVLLWRLASDDARTDLLLLHHSSIVNRQQTMEAEVKYPFALPNG